MNINNLKNDLNASLIQTQLQPSSNKNSLPLTNANADLLNDTSSLPQQNKAIDTTQLLANVASQQLGMSQGLLSSLQGGDSLTYQLVGMSNYADSFLKTNSLTDDLKNVVGGIIDETS